MTAQRFELMNFLVEKYWNESVDYQYYLQDQM